MALHRWIDEMHRSTTGETKQGYGVGFSIEEKYGYRIVSHGGGMPGVATLLQLFPNERLAIVVLSNSGFGMFPIRIAGRIAGELLPKWKVEELPKWKVDEILRTAANPPPFTTPQELRGNWKGTLSTYANELPVELRFLPEGDVHVKIGDQLETLVNHAQFRERIFTGQLASRIGTPDVERYRYLISLSLKLRGDVLNGWAAAFGAPKAPRSNALTHWLELKKQ